VNTLHLYAQVQWHDNAYIVGTKNSLTELRNAIDLAIAGHEVKMEADVADGEGYDVFVVMLDDHEPLWNELRVPYTDSLFNEIAYPNQTDPYMLIGDWSTKE
jgi:hypothetical protein